MKVLFIEAGTSRIEAMDIEPTLEKYYELINCDCINIAVRTVGGKEFDFIVDDEGLLKPGFKFAAINGTGTDGLAGNVIVCGMPDEEGYETGLTDEDIKLLFSNIYTLTTKYDYGEIKRYDVLLLS